MQSTQSTTTPRILTLDLFYVLIIRKLFFVIHYLFRVHSSVLLQLKENETYPKFDDPFFADFHGLYRLGTWNSVLQIQSKQFLNLYDTNISTKNLLSTFGLIEETMYLSRTLLAVLSCSDNSRISRCGSYNLCRIGMGGEGCNESAYLCNQDILKL